MRGTAYQHVLVECQTHLTLLGAGFGTSKATAYRYRDDGTAGAVGTVVTVAVLSQADYALAGCLSGGERR